jgi:hypothetical protein
VHFGLDVDLRDFERLVPKPGLDFHQVEASAQPVGSRSFPERVRECIRYGGEGGIRTYAVSALFAFADVCFGTAS